LRGDNNSASNANTSPRQAFQALKEKRLPLELAALELPMLEPL
jgi:hypothetical protein